MSNRNLRPIKFGPLGEEIDKKDLLAVIRRFQNIHQVQLRHILESLTQRQREFLTLLPLLFHTNHPLLPGFISTETPTGIPGYIPSKAALQGAARLSKSFEYKRHAQQDPPVHAIFLMGSVGSIAYSKRSDLDIWLCHAPDMDPCGLEEIRQKAGAIESWGATLGLEAHIFFINPEQFRAGIGEPISTESCGDIQHHLLLEEFYRTSLYIAGRFPAWWLVPPEQERQYTVYLNHLRNKRFINFADFIDLGGLERISAEEFMGGTLWHLYKAISSPHKSLLKLLLMEIYASEFPQPEWLCTRLKTSVYAGNLDVRELDSYILMYRRVEAQLARQGESARLELARQCFYLKINEVMSTSGAATSARQERRDTLKAMLNEWGWSATQVRELDGRRRWRIQQVLEEQDRISRELTRSYQAIRRFAQDHAASVSLESNELMLLGRRLYAALERKPGKVEILSNDGYEKVESEDLSLHEVRLADGNAGWLLYDGLIGADDRGKPEPLKRARSLLEIMAWLLLNSFYRKSGSLHLETATSTLTVGEFRSSMDALMAFVRKHHQVVEDLSAYESASRIRASTVFVNIGHDPEPDRRDGLQLTSSRFDALSFGSRRINLIHTVDRISFTTWQEVSVSRHAGLEGLFDCLCEILNQSSEAHAPPAFECVSFGSIRSRSIALRIQELYRDLQAVFRASGFPRYVVRGGSALFVFERREGVIRNWNLPDEAQLMVELSAPRMHFGAVIFDRGALDASPLPLIFAQNREGLIQIFFLTSAQSTEIFILDEKGSLYHRTHPDSDPMRLLGSYALFVAAMRQRYVTSVQGLQYFRIDAKGDSGYALTTFAYNPIAAGKKLNVRVFGLEWTPGQSIFTICCNDREFSSMDSGEDVFAQVAEHIAQIRQSGEAYPIYISDVDVPLNVLGVDTAEQLQTQHFLNYKRKIEDRLNQR